MTFQTEIFQWMFSTIIIRPCKSLDIVFCVLQRVPNWDRQGHVECHGLAVKSTKLKLWRLISRVWVQSTPCCDTCILKQDNKPWLLYKSWGGVVLSALQTRLLMDDTQAYICMDCKRAKCVSNPRVGGNGPQHFMWQLYLHWNAGYCGNSQVVVFLYQLGEFISEVPSSFGRVYLSSEVRW